MEGLFLLFYEPYAEGARDSEKTVNRDITQVKVTVNRIPSKVYSQRIKRIDLKEEVYWRFRKENSSMTPSGFYARDRFALFIDLRRMKETVFHGSGMRLVNTKDGVQVIVNNKTSGSGEVKCHIVIFVRRSVQHRE